MGSGGTLVHCEFKFSRVSNTLSMVVKNLPGTAKVLDSNLTRNCVFQRVNISVQKHFDLYLVILFCRLS